MRFRGRELLSILFASAIVIACSKKNPPAPTAPPDPGPSASASSDTTTSPSVAPSLAPPASSVVTTPTATATTILPPPAEPNASADPKTADALSKNKAPHGRKPAKHSGARSDADPELEDLRQAQTEGDLDRPKKAPAPPPPPVTKPATKPTPGPTPAPTTTAKVDEEKRDDKPSQPAGTALKRQVTITTAPHYACTTKELKESVSVLAETRGARITIGGQGPCPGEIKEWTAEVADKRVDVHGTHGAQSKCTCGGTGDMVLRGLEPGTYDVHVNGGFNRPIAVRVVVGSP